MSVRMLIVGLMLTTALAFGLMAIQMVRTPEAVVYAPGAPPAPLTVDYLTAARALPIGALLRNEDLTTTSVAPAKLPPNALIDGPATRATLRGGLVRRYVDPGAAVTADDV